MNCQRVQDNFIDYQDGSLPADEAAQDPEQQQRAGTEHVAVAVASDSHPRRWRGLQSHHRCNLPRVP